MARILCVTDSLAGLLFSSLELAHRLQAAGHEVIYASYPDIEPTVEEHGLRFVSLKPSRYGDFVAIDSERGFVTRLLTVGRRRDQAARALAVDDFADTVRSIGPDLILIDGEMHEQIITASQTGVPMALLVPFVSIWRRPGLPPPHHLARPGIGWRGTTVGITLLWWNLRLRKLRTTVRQTISHVGCDRVSVLRRLARDVGFDFRDETDFGQWLIPFTYRSLPALCTHAFEFEFPHRPRDGVHYTGPMIPEHRVDHRVTDEARLELAEIFERRRRSAGARTLIYAGFGSFFSTNAVLLRRLIDAVAGCPHWDLVISLGDRISLTGLGPMPTTVRAFAWVPQLEVLRHSDVSVHHGGINTIDECVAQGVPMLMYWGGATDMAGSVARAVHHGIGIAGNRQRDTPATIRGHLKRLLEERSFQDNVARLRTRYADYAENHVAERVVESLLHDSQPAANGPSRPTTEDS